MQRIIILRMTCWPIQPNLWAGPDPRDDEDFRNLQSQNITAVLSLQDEEDRGDGGIESERAAAARVGLAFEKRSGQGLQQCGLATTSSPVRRRVGASVGSAAHCVRSLHRRCQPFAQCSCSLSPLVFRMGPKPGAGTCHAVPPVLIAKLSANVATDSVSGFLCEVPT
jgi:hypothetical protein